MLALQDPTHMSALIARLEAELAGQALIDTPMHPDCEVVVVIPVRAERVERLTRLLKSVAMQDIDLRRVEVMMVVNNRPPEESPEWHDAYSLNQVLLGRPWGIPGLAVHTIDQSSHGLWVPGSNVGMARQRGLAEAALRFASIGRNGLVFQTDADCWLDDPSFLFKLLWLFSQNPALTALGGHYTLELDVRDPEAKGIFELLPSYKQHQRYQELYRDVTRGNVGRTEPLNTLGRCIVSRAFESIEVGGVPPIPHYEDFEFCMQFEKAGMEMAWGHKLGIGLMSAFRLSDRTPSSIRSELERVARDGGVLLVDDAFNPGHQIELDETYIGRLADAVREMENGEARLGYIFFQHPIMRLRIVGL
jgi:hypothetical protein